VRIVRLTIVLTAVLLVAGGLLQPATAAPSSGYNEWACQPGSVHPNPVVLVHGLGANGTENWLKIGPLLASQGYCAYSLTYGVDRRYSPVLDSVGGLLPMEQSAGQLSAFVGRVRAATHAAKVDIVGHSEGSLMPDYYVKFLGGAAYVDHYVGITPVWHGTNFLGLGALATQLPAVASLATSVCQSCTEFLPGSAFLQKLNSGGAAVPGVTYTTLMTRYDEAVIPYTSGYLDGPNVTNIVVQDQCGLDLAEHIAMAFDPVTAQDILNALDPAHAKPPACTLVLPFVGSPG
jgi:triacylglycerol esterase/lipase EstA (alpha/beta hydrolase family)